MHPIIKDVSTTSALDASNKIVPACRREQKWGGRVTQFLNYLSELGLS